MVPLSTTKWNDETQDWDVNPDQSSLADDEIQPTKPPPKGHVYSHGGEWDGTLITGGGSGGGSEEDQDFGGGSERIEFGTDEGGNQTETTFTTDNNGNVTKTFKTVDKDGNTIDDYVTPIARPPDNYRPSWSSDYEVANAAGGTLFTGAGSTTGNYPPGGKLEAKDPDSASQGGGGGHTAQMNADSKGGSTRRVIRAKKSLIGGAR